MKKTARIFAAAALALAAWAGLAAAGEVRVLAAAEWREALEDAAAGFRGQTGLAVTVEYAGEGGALAALLGGAEADVFLPEGEAGTEGLKAAGRASSVSRNVVVKGRAEGGEAEYVAATVPAECGNRTGGKLFVDYLSGEPGRQIWRAHGFEVP